MTVAPKLKLGLPKGSLEEATIDLFSRAGWKIRRNLRNYFPEINDPDITARLCRVQEIPAYVADGILDCGITGRDWLLETGADVVVVSDLVYSKASRRPARWVLAVDGNSAIATPEDLEGKRIATELPEVTKRYFEDRGIHVHVQYSWGATEAKVVEGLADAIVEVTETGATIRAHGLKIIDVVLVSNPQLIASPAAWASPWKRDKIESLNLLVAAALRAESLVGLKMNVPENKLAAVLAILPSLNSPTVSNLQNDGWCAVEIVVDSDTVRDLIPRLRSRGAEGIIEYSLNKVL